MLLPNIEIWPKSHCSDWKSLEFKPVDCRVVHHEVRPVVYNKAIFKLHATSLDKKAMALHPKLKLKHCQSSVLTDRMATPGSSTTSTMRRRPGAEKKKGNRGAAIRGCRKRKKLRAEG